MTCLKKNLATLVQRKPDARLFFFDESRFGTHSKIGHGWFKKGTRPRISVKLGFQNFYLYTAASPLTGETQSLILPYVNTDCMNEFLAHMAQTLGTSEAILVMDGAGWHKSQKLLVPDNIHIVTLPPYSPELNPVERLWQHIKSNTIKNRLYESLNALEDAICLFLSTLTTHSVLSICSCDYLYC